MFKWLSLTKAYPGFFHQGQFQLLGVAEIFLSGAESRLFSTFRDNRQEGGRRGGEGQLKRD